MSTDVLTDGQPLWVSALAQALVFQVVLCLAATLDFSRLPSDRHSGKQLLAGVTTAAACQFFLQPLLAFFSVKLFSLDQHVGTILLIITSCPGGTNSNYFCRLANSNKPPLAL